MQPVNYDDMAPAYERRYDRYAYPGVRAHLQRFVDGVPGSAVAEVGCGTGHWLAELSNGAIRSLAGLDRSRKMLERARAAVPRARLAQGTASQLCWVDACFDRVFSVNAIHHFPDLPAFFSEGRRVLRRGGGLLTIGLDPHTGDDEWWVYEFFPSTRDTDRRRYASAAMIRERLVAAGFRDPSTEAAEHIVAAISFDAASQQGLVDRRATSQLMLLSDAEYDAGMERLRDERPVLRSNVRLYATVAWT